MDRMQSRYHSPHRLSLGFIVSKNESPNEKRFLNINRSPIVLSNFKMVNSPDLDGYSPRDDSLPEINCARLCYDSKLDFVRQNPSKAVFDFDKRTSRKDMILNGSGFKGIIDNMRVVNAKDTIILPRQMLGNMRFEKFQGRDWEEVLKYETNKNSE